jgi:sugar phosphate isomerase/epimerase
MRKTLGLNLGFAVNRYSSPLQWTELVADELGIKSVQFTADLLNPYLSDNILWRLADETREKADQKGISIDSVFTGAFTRLNHFSHPDAELRQWWCDWFRRFCRLAAVLGAKSLGSHFGILTIPDCADSELKARRFRDNLDCWKYVAEAGADNGLQEICWEPMSIEREYGHNVADVKRVQDALENMDAALPFRLCLDVDHGDVDSLNPDDTDPYYYLRHFARQTSQVHLKQSYANKGGHWPFTPEHNERGNISPKKVLAALQEGGAGDVSLILELSFRERGPSERMMLNDLKQSVEFWKPFCD